MPIVKEFSSLMLFSNKQDTVFYDLLEAQAAAAYDAATVFLSLVSDFADMPVYLKRLEDIEHEADKLTYTLNARVDSRFVTPLDKSDLHRLSERLDGITDAIEAAALRIGAFHLTAPRSDLPALASLLVGITQETQTLVSQLRHGFKKSELSAVMGGIHALEKQSDKIFWQALSELLDDAALDARALIKWKEVYERIEKAINRCEKVAGLVESLMVKYA